MEGVYLYLFYLVVFIWLVFTFQILSVFVSNVGVSSSVIYSLFLKQQISHSSFIMSAPDFSLFFFFIPRNGEDYI